MSIIDSCSTRPNPLSLNDIHRFAHFEFPPERSISHQVGSKISESRVAPCESRVRVFGAREYAILLTFRPEPACAWYTFQGCNSLSISDNLAQLSQEEEADDGKEVTWGTRGHPYQHDLF